MKPSEKLLRKIENSIGIFGISKILNLKNFDLDWPEEAALELASSLILNSEKKKKLEKASKNSGRKRRQFPKLIKQRVLILQNFCCKMCQNRLEFPEFDHIDGNSANNKMANCQALCANCHAKKTRKTKL